MDTPALALEVDSTALPRGTKVGAWRVDGIGGRGTYGTVYGAVAEGGTHAGPVALKLAAYSGDPRFEREVELLSRIRHPSVPRLLDSGQWRSPRGGVYPFVVMEWVEGEPLYTWAARRNPSSRQVLAVLGQAAGALQATHAVSGVHRDVKGDNMLVRPADGRLFLTDFGAGFFAGAPRLTPLQVLPGTPHYRSPRLWQYLWHGEPDATAPLLALPADDVFALGVTAYRLVTDTYPAFSLTHVKGGQSWRAGGNGFEPPKQLNPQVDAQLSALILRMVSSRPEERGAAWELAEAMEQGVKHAGPSADALLFEWETLKPSQWTEDERAEAAELGHRPRRRNREKVLKVEQADIAARARAEQRQADACAPTTRPNQQVKSRTWLPWLAAVLALGLWPEETGSLSTGTQSTKALSTFKKEGDPVSLGEAALSASSARDTPSAQEAITDEFPEQPFPWQLKPDAQGRCPKRQIAINGGCWAKVDFALEDCPGNGFVYQGGCYVPARATAKVPTSAPRKR
jgi:serine/threonine protein kinase